MNSKLEKAAALVAEAREVRDRYGDNESLSKADAEHIDRCLREASNLRKDAERETQLSAAEEWLGEPQRKVHDDGGMRGIDGDHTHEPASQLPRSAKSFTAFVRGGLSAVERKADLIEDSSGELLVPPDYAGTIFKDVTAEAVFRNLAYVRPTTKNRVHLGSINAGQTAWGKLETSDGDPLPDGLGAAPDQDEIRVWNLVSLVKIGVDELDDADDNLEALVRARMAEEFAAAEDAAFANGAGDASFQPFSVTNGVDQSLNVATAGVVTADEMKSLPFEVASRFRRRGAFVVNADVEKQVALLKDANDHYLLQPSVRAGEPPTFGGYRMYAVDDLGTNKGAVFGDFRSGYMIADRKRVTVTRLVEKYATEGKVGLLFTHRVGGDVVRPGALAYLDLTTAV